MIYDSKLKLVSILYKYPWVACFIKKVIEVYKLAKFKKTFSAAKLIECEVYSGDDSWYDFWFKYITWNPYYKHLNEYRKLYEYNYGLKISKYIRNALSYSIKGGDTIGIRIHKVYYTSIALYVI